MADLFASIALPRRQGEVVQGSKQHVTAWLQEKPLGRKDSGPALSVEMFKKEFTGLLPNNNYLTGILRKDSQRVFLHLFIRTRPLPQAVLTFISVRPP
jgi:hypothetical protein